MKKVLKLVFLLYLFILCIELIKKSSMVLASKISDFILTLSTMPLKAVCVGWFTTSIIQSSGAVGTIAATFAGNNLIGLQTAIFIVIGASLGTSITALIISFIIKAKKRRDFRHGFEIGLCSAIYSAIVIFIAFLLEYFFKAFSKISLFFGNAFVNKISLLKIPDITSIITSPIISIIFKLNSFLILVLAFITLILVLRFMGKAVIDVLGGEEKARCFINKYFKSKYKSYLIGAILTGIVFSSSITIGLLVPLATARLINLKKAIPFIIGARLGTSTDVLLASIILNKSFAIATAFSYILFGILGTIIFLPETEILFKITKYVSKKVIHISRKKTIYFLIGFIIIPLLIIFLL